MSNNTKIGIIEVTKLSTGNYPSSDTSGVKGLMQGNTYLEKVNCQFPVLINGQNMFRECTNLSTVNAQFDMLTTGIYMFGKCSNLMSISGSAPYLVNGLLMFLDCGKLTEETIQLDRFTDTLQEGYGMFQKSGITSIPWDFPNLVNAVQMFYKANITELELNTSKTFPSIRPSSAAEGFQAAGNDGPGVPNPVAHMFAYCPLTTLKFDVSSLSNGLAMFSHCDKLTTCTGAVFQEEGNYQNMFTESKFDEASALTIFQAAVSANVEILHIGCGFPLSADCQFASTNSLNLDTISGDNSGKQWIDINYPNIIFVNNSSETQSISIDEDNYPTPTEH